MSRASLKYLHSTSMTKHPSRKVMNFRHLLGRDTIEHATFEIHFTLPI